MALQGGAGGGGPSPAHASICRRGRDLRGCRGGARRGTGDAGTRWRGVSALLEGGVPSASAGREHQRAPHGPARGEGACFPVGEDGARQTARGSSAATGVRDPPLSPGSLQAAARDCSVERESGGKDGWEEMTVAPACGPGCTVGAPGICCSMDHSYQETVDEMMECGGLEGLARGADRRGRAHGGVGAA